MNFSNLICPLCNEELRHESPHPDSVGSKTTLHGYQALRAGQLRCPNNHSFDIARQGYVNLLPVQQKKSKYPGDSKPMVAARSQFLNSGTYEPIAKQLATTMLQHLSNADTGSWEQERAFSVLDAGCGEGYYLDYVTQMFNAQRPQQRVMPVGLDISKEAIAAAAKRSPNITWIVGSNAKPPLKPASVDQALCVFGFPSYEGFLSVLKPDGHILLVDPGPDHLVELRQVIYPEVKHSPLPSLAKAEARGFELIESQQVQYQTPELQRQDIQNLLSMTPYLYRATEAGREAAAQIKRLSVTVQVVLRVLARRRG